MNLKTLPVSVRLLPDTKAALEKAAKDDLRSTSSLMEKILVEWLRAKGYLPAGGPDAVADEPGPAKAGKARPSPAKPAGKKPKA
jgi:hypothetical protein